MTLNSCAIPCHLVEDRLSGAGQPDRSPNSDLPSRLSCKQQLEVYLADHTLSQRLSTKMSALDNDNETQPLIQKDPLRPATPLPKLQLALICFLRITEPIAFLVCFPFVNQMLLDVGAVDDPKDVGWPAGIVSRPTCPLTLDRISIFNNSALDCVLLGLPV